jgi:hypothetical protein
MPKKAKKKLLQKMQNKRDVARQHKQRRKTKMSKHDDEENAKRAKHDEEQRAKKAADQRAKQHAADEDPVGVQVHQRTDKPAEELMSTPEVSPAPNPPSPPGGEMIGEPTVLVPHSEPAEQSLKEQRPTNPGPGERQRLTDEDRQR